MCKMYSQVKLLGEGGGRVLNKCFYKEALPLGPTPYPFIHLFSRKRYPFFILCLELCIQA